MHLRKISGIFRFGRSSLSCLGTSLIIVGEHECEAVVQNDRRPIYACGIPLRIDNGVSSWRVALRRWNIPAGASDMGRGVGAAPVRCLVIDFVVRRSQKRLALQTDLELVIIITIEDVIG